MKTRLLAAMRAAVCAVLFALLALPAARATDNNFPTPGGGTADGKVLMCVNSSGQAVPCGNSTTPVQIGGTFSATLSGFTPGGTFATITASATSGSVALPAGTVVAFQNTGSAAVSCTLGVGSATATANEVVIQAASTVFVTVGSNTFGACIDQTGSTSNTVVLAGGSGLGTGFGGGGGGGGGSSSITTWGGGTLGAMANYGTSPGAVLVPGMNASVTASVLPTGAATSANQTNKTQFTQLTDGTNAATAYTAYGTAPSGLVPAFNTFVTNSNANGQAAASASSPVVLASNQPVSNANSSVAINISTATTTQLVALSGTTKIYVTSWDVIAGGTGNITLEYGTGTACATGTTVLTGAYNLVAQAGISKGDGSAPVLVIPAGNALCALTSAAVQMSGSLTYQQF